ncbi:MAG: response regulator [Anaerolineaceae bacterium]|nr:response regulator [Anaerolineaceae bacterium]
MNGNKKLRVVLIDDESIIVEGLRRVVKWSDYNCEVAGTASDARSGAQLIREVRPDILFTDIYMPGQNGLTMLAGLRSEFPEMQVTVLTGYRDFAYAQEAIRLGVTRFLLKPSKMSEIHEALTAMTEKIVGKETPSPDQNTGSFIVNQAVAFMEKHYTEKVTLQDVAETCYVSQWHLSKLLNKYAGQSFYDILNGIRINAAKELLKDPSLRVGDVGIMVGYTDLAHFARIFKKLTGCSANEYRNSLHV